MKIRFAFRSLLNAPGLSIIVIATLALGSLSASVAASPRASDGEINRMLRTRVDLQKKATGIVIGMIDPQGRRIVSYGTMSLEAKRPVDGKTIFEVGSITKVFTALLLADMAQRGEVALDDQVDRLAGHYRYSPTDTIKVTRAGDHLLVVLSTGEKLELFAEGERDFFAKSIDVQITFDASPNESANAAVWHQAGQSQRGERVTEPPTTP